MFWGATDDAFTVGSCAPVQLERLWRLGATHGQAKGPVGSKHDDGQTRRGGTSCGGPPVTHPDRRRGTRLPGVATGPVGEDLGRL